jgi:hypothetical protein
VSERESRCHRHDSALNAVGKKTFVTEVLAAPHASGYPGPAAHQFGNEPLGVAMAAEEVSVAPVVREDCVTVSQKFSDNWASQLLAYAGMNRAAEFALGKEGQERLFNKADKHGFGEYPMLY